MAIVKLLKTFASHSGPVALIVVPMPRIETCAPSNHGHLIGLDSLARVSRVDFLVESIVSKR